MPSPIRIAWLFSALVCALGLVAALGVPQHSPEPITRLAFGSCNKVERPQPAWKPIRAWHPHLWIWLGDIVYYSNI